MVIVSVSEMSDPPWKPLRKMTMPRSRSRSDQTSDLARLQTSTPPSPGNPPIIALVSDGTTSASATPPKKKWEQHYKKFLTKRILGSPRSFNSGETTLASTVNNNSSCEDDSGSGRSGMFPGSRRIVHRKKSDLLPPLASSSMMMMPAMPDLTTATSTSNDETDAAVRGGSFFQSVFSRERSTSTESNNGHHHHSKATLQQQHKGRTRSTDSLDSTLRGGQDKTYSPKNHRFLFKKQLERLEPPLVHGAAAAVATVTTLPPPPPPQKLDNDNDRPVHGGVTSPPVSPQTQRVPSALALPAASTTTTLRSSREMKKAFTEYHNSTKFSLDASSPFLGDDPSSRRNRNNRNDYLAMPKQLQQHSRNGQLALSQSERNLSGLSLYPPNKLTPSSLPVVSEDAVVMNRSMRMLKPVQGPESWEARRRYLIAPAALSTCPLFVLNLLDKEKFRRNEDDDSSSSLSISSIFYPIELGTATVKYVGSNHPDWTTCSFLLRQNYLLEYPEEEVIKGTTPRGFAHLQYAKAYPHDDFSDALELEFYASPCARSDKRVLFLRVGCKERDRWVTCLNDAAQLRIKDLYDYDEGRLFGRGRYAAVYPARRRDDDDSGKMGTSTDCALKIIDKNEFWRRVVGGVERADTIVMETSVQATLTAKCGALSTFLQIRGIFETCDHFVIELELLEGMDLFQHVSSKSVMMEEDESAQIMRDIFTSLNAMARNGIAHRDIKPANILMCNREKCGVSVKVADFGMSGFAGVDGHLRGRCGTPGYVAPEMWTASVHGGYGNKVDVFSAGVTLYVLLCGYEPFYGESDTELIAANKAAIVDYPEEDWSRISLEARDLVERTLERDPTKRISAKEALEHPWIVTRAPPTATALTESSRSLAGEGTTCTVS